MATGMTEKERWEKINHCLELEKSGGDILGYLAENWPSYTPRATWINIQKEYLKRKEWQISSGGPEKLEKDMNDPKPLEMETEAAKVAEELAKDGRILWKSLEERAQTLIDILKKGGSPWDYYTRLGASDPAKSFRLFRNKLKNARPDLYAEMQALIIAHASRKPEEKETAKKPPETAQNAACEPLQTAEGTTTDGDFDVTAVRGKFGDYLLTDDMMRWTFNGKSITLQMDTWKKVIQEMQNALSVLGVSKYAG